MRYRLAVLFSVVTVGCLLFWMTLAQSKALANEAPRPTIDLPVGQNVEIWFRGDALGVKQEGTATTDRLARQTGTIVKNTDRWLVLSNGGSEFWVPRDVILMVKTK